MSKDLILKGGWMLNLKSYNYEQSGGVVVIGKLIPKSAKLPTLYVVRQSTGFYVVDENGNILEDWDKILK